MLEYREKNQERLKEYRRKNKDKYNLYQKRWTTKNPDWWKKYKHPKQYSEIKCSKCDKVFIPTKITKIYCSEECQQANVDRIRLRLRFKILQRDNFTCQYCGRKAPDVELQIDHKYPKSKNNNYKYKPKDLITACSDCNNGKSDIILDEFK